MPQNGLGCNFTFLCRVLQIRKTPKAELKLVIKNSSLFYLCQKYLWKILWVCKKLSIAHWPRNYSVQNADLSRFEVSQVKRPNLFSASNTKTYKKCCLASERKGRILKCEYCEDNLPCVIPMDEEQGAPGS